MQRCQLASTTHRQHFASATRRLILVSVAAVAATATVCGQTTAQGQPVELGSRSNQLQLKNCFTMLVEDVDVPARETGSLKEMLVREGALVSASQPLASIDDAIVQRRREEAEAKLNAAEKKATSTVELDYARAAFDVAESQWTADYELRRQGSISQSEYEKSFLEKRRTELQIQRAENDMTIERLNADAERVSLALVTDAIARHQITSPLDGNVMEIYKQVGEWVQAGDPICRVVRMNRIRVQGYVEASRFNPEDVANRHVTVTATMAGDRREQFTGRIVYVGLEKSGVQGASYQVWAEVDNRSVGDHWQLLPGTEVEMTIHLDSIAAAPKIDQSSR